MKVGDLVKHKSNGCYGTITQVRKHHWQKLVGMAKVYWLDDGVTILHSTGQLEVINEN